MSFASHERFGGDLSADAGVPNESRKRSRTGCLTCRKRRRKCDESRPICSNCIEKKLECIYGVLVTFLETNTLAVPDIQDPASRKRQWERLEFVEETGRPVSKQLLPGNTSRQDTSPAPSVPRSGLLTVATRDERSPNGNTNINTNSIIKDWTTSASSYTETGGGAPNTNEQDFDRTAPIYSGTQVSNSDCPPAGLPDIYTTIEQDTHFSPTSRPATIQQSWNSLRYYSYHIAPWFDILDNQYSFRLLPLMQDQPSINESLHILASEHHTCSNRIRFQASSDVEFALRSIVPDQGDIEPMQHVAGLLSMASALLATPSDDWRQVFSQSFIPLRNLIHYAHSTSVFGAAYWVLVRFDLAQAFASSEMPFLCDQVGSRRRKSAFRKIQPQGPRERSAGDCKGLLLLALEVASMLNSPEETTLKSTRQWQGLWQDVEDWHITSTDDVKPIFERPAFHDEDDFPVMCFTTSMALFATFLYHSLVHMLLAAKPRLVDLGNRTETNTSILYHAKRVCAIAAGNRESLKWDLFMIPLLESAARYMTHQHQQQRVLQAFDFVVATMGWKVEGVVNRLTTSWTLGAG